MRRFYSHKLSHPVVSLKAGEYFATERGEVIFTLLGSCIAACLYDSESATGGMNHFMLPNVTRRGGVLASEAGRFGAHAMELLIGELIKLGVRRSSLRAKLFGGANLLGLRELKSDPGRSNIAFAREFLSSEGIPLVNEDVGGECGRKVLFFSGTARVLLKRFNISHREDLIDEELTFREEALRRQSEKPPLIIFRPRVESEPWPRY